MLQRRQTAHGTDAQDGQPIARLVGHAEREPASERVAHQDDSTVVVLGGGFFVVDLFDEVDEDRDGVAQWCLGGRRRRAAVAWTVDVEHIVAESVVVFDVAAGIVSFFLVSVFSLKQIITHETTELSKKAAVAPPPCSSTIIGCARTLRPRLNRP